jgi:type I restriction enzyme S subunit
MVNGWLEKVMAEIAPLQRGFDLPTSQIINGEYPIVYSNGVGGNHNVAMAKAPGVITGRSGTIGSLTYVDKDYFPHNTTLWVTDFKGNNALFIYYLFHKVDWQRFATGSGVPTLNRNYVHEIRLCIPQDKAEQRRIAEVLSDTDALLSATEKLIAKKRAIKQGTMQELLTGKRRLPGFEGKWAEKKLGDLFDITSSKRVFQSEWRPSGVPFYRAREIAVLSETGSVNNELFIDKEMYEKYTREYGSIQTNDVLITGVGTLGKVYVVKAKDRFYFKDGNIIWLKSKGLLNSAFLKQLYFTEGILNQVFGTSGGSTVGTYTIKNANETIIPYLSLEEQTAIAEILSDMDAEIDTLTAKLNKLRNIKRGMMSELLTGRIRLMGHETQTALVAAAAPKTTELSKRKPQAVAQKGGHNQQFDDAVIIAGIVNVLYSDKFPLGRKKVQKCLYLLRRHKDENTTLFKKGAAGPYSNKVRYKGGEYAAQLSGYILTKTNDKGTTFAPGKNINKALGYIQKWGRQADIKWIADKLKFKKVDELELLATVDMAICDLTDAGTPVSVVSIKHLIATNAKWKAKLKKQTFSDINIARAIRELHILL